MSSAHDVGVIVGAGIACLGIGVARIAYDKAIFAPVIRQCYDSCGVEVKVVSKFFLFCVIFLALIASSALGQDVSFTFDDKADFSKFKTYKWITLEKVAPIDELTDKQIKAAVDAALVRKGLTKVGGEAADLLIGFQTTEQVQEQFPGIDPDSGVRTGLPANTSTSTRYKGQLAINMYDPANHHLIWRGVATKTVNRKANPEKRQKNLNKAVAKLMQKYPPIVVGGPH